MVNQLISRYAQKLHVCCSSEHEATGQAWALLELVTGKTQAQLLVDKNFQLSAEQIKKLETWAQERIQLRKPLQYIIGSVPFIDLEIHVRPPILIPRPETEEWVAQIIQDIKHVGFGDKKLTILDMCSGSGCIALALAHAFPKAQVWGLDINPAAIVLAKENQEHLKFTNVTFIESDLYGALPSGLCFDLIVSNPPYIFPSEFERLQPEVKNWEDEQALTADDVFDLYKRIAQGACERINLQSELRQGGLPQVVVEVGLQAHEIADMCVAQGFSSVSVHKDMSQQDRWISLFV